MQVRVFVPTRNALGGEDAQTLIDCAMRLSKAETERSCRFWCDYWHVGTHVLVSVLVHPSTFINIPNILLTGVDQDTWNAFMQCNR